VSTGSKLGRGDGHFSRSGVWHPGPIWWGDCSRCKGSDEPLRVFTSRYSNADIAVSGLVPVGITAFPPKFKLTYHVVAHLRELAPSPGLLAQVRSGAITKEQFRARYIARLDALGPNRVRSMLTVAQGGRSGVVLLCFENVNAGERCHRRYLAEWLTAKLGLVVPELLESH
jgi:uncharacterized protein YeaO (DUF488 family)